MEIEKVILANLLTREEYARKVFPFIKAEYFESRSSKELFKLYRNYVAEYGEIPTKSALLVELEENERLDQDTVNEITELIKVCFDYADEPDIDWLVESTESFCRDRAVFLAVEKSITILDGEDKKTPKTQIPELLSEALAVSFDTDVGHDFLGNAEQRWDFYHKKEERLPFNLDWFNKITDGGLPKKTLSAFLAPTNVGKTLVMCHLAADFLMAGHNVLYITMEMAEERISERIDANLLDIEISDLRGLPKQSYIKRIEDLKKRTKGRLIVKEYPTASAHVGHFRHLLKELELKQKFVPDVVFVDYLNICASSRLRSGYENTYVLVKSIAEEMRGLAVERNMAIVTATQTNRQGWGASDLDLSDTSESAGLPATLDLFIGIILTEEMKAMGQLSFKQLKNRFTDVTKNVRTVLGVDRPKMKLFPLDGPKGVEDASSSKNEEFDEFGERRQKKHSFEGFKI